MMNNIPEKEYWRLILTTLLAMVMLLALSGCLAEDDRDSVTTSGTTSGSGSSGNSGTSSDTWTTIQSAISGQGCTGCHGSAAFGGLNMSSGQYSTLIAQTSSIDGTKRIITVGSKEDSTLFLVTNGDLTPNNSADMTISAQSASIGAWIDAGAPEN